MRIPETRRKGAFRLAALLVAFGLAAVPMLAQTDVTTSRISGTVEGSDGAPLPGVSIEATNTETGLVQVEVTDEQGFFRILNLPTGTYKVVASLEGFATSTADNVRLLLGSTPTINFTLQSSSVSESITVTAERPVVEVTNTQIGTTIQTEQLKNLPSAGRDFKQLVLLTPESRLDSERGNLSLSGERGINTSITVDGVDYNNAFFGGAVGVAEGRAPLSISQESIKEFSVVTNGASVEYGRSGGGFVNLITKNGTNNLHGSVFYFKQPQSMISNFPRVGPTPGHDPADQSKDQYGASLGGPIIKDKLFYFLSYDNQKQDITIPILASNLDPAVFARYPALTSPDAYVQTQDGWVAFGRLDYQLNPAHRLMFRSNWNDYEGVNGTSNSQSRAASYNGIEGIKAKSYVGSWSGQFGAEWLNDLSLNYVDEDIPRQDKGLNLPEIQVGGARYGEVSFLPIVTTNKRKAFSDTVSYLLDRHVLKAGTEYNDTSVDQIFKGNWRGVYIFANQADFLAGKWREYRQFGGLGGLSSDEAGAASFHQKENAFFVQDQWFVRNNVTVTAGIRYERLNNPDAPILNPSDPGPNGTLRLTGEIPDANNQISPRLGVSWAPDEKTAVRASVGRYWSRTPALLWAQPFTSNGIRGAQVNIFAQSGGAGPPTDSLAPGWGSGATATNGGFNPVGVERYPFGQVTRPTTPPNVFTVDPDFENPYTDRVTLGAEREILPRISFGLDFTYAKGHQLQRLTDINLVYDGTLSANGLPHYRPNATNTGPFRPLSAYGAVITDLSDAESKYKAVTATLQRRYSDHYSFYAAITWSKDRDNDSNERNFSGIQAEDVNNLGLNWGPSNRDQEWKGVLNGLWETPLWGISVSGTFRYYTGQPFNPIINAEINNDGVSGTDRPTINGHHLGRNSERQPDFYTLDMRLTKSFGIGPVSLAPFVECFNCSDRANTFISSTDQIWGTAQTPRTTFGVEDSFNVSYVPRTFQLGLRLDF
ncbi:MAG TPA: TonB-dependent receptor [Thermoanaerobaculia bacterium]|nr:TonB-dependent receptor [Thermoanaerobaculia bacterium]